MKLKTSSAMAYCFQPMPSSGLMPQRRNRGRSMAASHEGTRPCASAVTQRDSGQARSSVTRR